MARLVGRWTGQGEQEKVDRVNDKRKGSLDQNERIKRKPPLERTTEEGGPGIKHGAG